jgi:predicted Zn-dependent protease with MMP-like domain
MMERERFEFLAAKAFESLPGFFRKRIDNVHIAVEDEPSDSERAKAKISRGGLLLGLYSGIPLTQRGTWYGSFPTMPDKITLYQNNIEKVCQNEEEIEQKVYEVLFHEIGHYFGMSEEEIRKAMGEPPL